MTISSMLEQAQSAALDPQTEVVDVLSGSSSSTSPICSNNSDSVSPVSDWPNQEVNNTKRLIEQPASPVKRAKIEISLDGEGSDSVSTNLIEEVSAKVCEQEPSVPTMKTTKTEPIDIRTMFSQVSILNKEYLQEVDDSKGEENSNTSKVLNVSQDVITIPDEVSIQSQGQEVEPSLPLKDAVPSEQLRQLEIQQRKLEQKLKKAELQTLKDAEKQKQKEKERQEKERKKEDERAKKKEEERLKKEAKRQKLEEQKLERDRKKEQEKAEKERKKEEEKLERDRKKEEERLKKNAEKEERERVRIEKKKKEDEEKKKKEDEEKDKYRNQMKISSFFARKPAVSTSTEPEVATSDASNSCDFDRDFLPFFKQKNVSMAIHEALSSMELRQAEQKIDKLLNSKAVEVGSGTSSSLDTFFQSFATVGVSSLSITPEDIVSALNSSTTTESQLCNLLTQIPPIKYLSFYENSKPPYIGTWFSKKHQETKLSSPTDTSQTDFDYGYDSDLEWNSKEDEEEGEDLDEDEEDEEEMVVEDDDIFDDFVEDNSEQPKRKIQSMVIVNILNDGRNDDFFKTFTVQAMAEVEFPVRLVENHPTSVSPPTETAVNGGPSSSVTAGSVSEIRGLASSTEPNVLVPQKKTIKDASTLADLVAFVKRNPDYTLNTLAELSRKEFKFTKAILKNTIQDIAVYNKKSQKWDIKAEVEERYKEKV